MTMKWHSPGHNEENHEIYPSEQLGNWPRSELVTSRIKSALGVPTLSSGKAIAVLQVYGPLKCNSHTWLWRSLMCALGWDTCSSGGYLQFCVTHWPLCSFIADSNPLL
jgi:hypothetical protein